MIQITNILVHVVHFEFVSLLYIKLQLQKPNEFLKNFSPYFICSIPYICSWYFQHFEFGTPEYIVSSSNI